MDFLPNSKVAVIQKQMHGNISLITPGEFVSAQGNVATVLLEGEEVVRNVPLDSISSAEEMMGNLSNRANEYSVIDLCPRR